MIAIVLGTSAHSHDQPLSLLKMAVRQFHHYWGYHEINPLDWLVEQGINHHFEWVEIDETAREFDMVFHDADDADAFFLFYPSIHSSLIFDDEPSREQ